MLRLPKFAKPGLELKLSCSKCNFRDRLEPPKKLWKLLIP